MDEQLDYEYILPMIIDAIYIMFLFFALYFVIYQFDILIGAEYDKEFVLFRTNYYFLIMLFFGFM